MMSDSKCPSLPSFGIMRICSYSLEPKFVDKESGGHRNGLERLESCCVQRKNVSPFVSEISILLTMELKIPEFGMKFLD